VNDSTVLQLKVLFARVMRIDVGIITADSSTDTMATWNSLNHMKLVLALEEEFFLAFDESQIEYMTTFAKVKELVEQMKA
jgi:acyl carrier protein